MSRQRRQDVFTTDSLRRVYLQLLWESLRRTFHYNSLLQLTEQSLVSAGYNAYDISYSYSATQNNGRILQT